MMYEIAMRFRETLVRWLARSLARQSQILKDTYKSLSLRSKVEQISICYTEWQSRQDGAVSVASQNYTAVTFGTAFQTTQKLS